MRLIELPSQVRRHADRMIWECRGGAGKSRSFAELADDAVQAADRLRRLGVGAGMRVGILAENRYEWLVYDLALIELRCVTVALVPDVVEQGLLAAAVRFELHLIVTDQAAGDDETCVLNLLNASADANVRDGLDLEDDPDYDAPAWVFSSGSTGRIRVIRTRREGVELLVNSLPQAFELKDGDRFLVFLPMPSFQQRFLLYCCLWNGIDLIISEPRFLFAALKRHAPTILLAPPAFYEAVAARVRNAPRWKLFVINAVAILSRWIPLRRVRQALSSLVSKPVRQTFGGQVRLMITGMAPIKQQTLALFDSLDMPIYEVYGMTECGMIAWNTPSARRAGSVGLPLADVKLTLADDGEVIVERDLQPTSGYLFEDSDEETARTYVSCNAIATGDVGRLDDCGFLHLLGRKKNVIVTPGGAKIHPESIEDYVNRCPEVERAVVFGCDGAGLAAVIVPAVDNEDARVVIKRHIVDVNNHVGDESTIARVVFAPPLTREDGLLTANLKLDRQAIAARFQNELFPNTV